MHTSTDLWTILQNCLDLEKMIMLKFKDNGKNMLLCLNDLKIISFLVELLLQKGHFGLSVHTQMHTSTYLL